MQKDAEPRRPQESTRGFGVVAVELLVIVTGVLIALAASRGGRTGPWTRTGARLWSFGFQTGDAGSEGLIPAYADLKGSGRLGLLPDTVRVGVIQEQRAAA